MKTLEPAISLSLKNILLATDFSPGSETALKYAQAIAQRHASHVHVIHVTAPDSYRLLDPEAFAITFNQPGNSAVNATDVLHALLEGLPTQTPVRQGLVWEVISDVVRRNEIDLLVLASHGRHGIFRMVMGSVAEDVFRNISCPVLTVGPDVKPCDGGGFNIQRVLLATHFEKTSSAPLYAALLCNEFHAGLTALHVVEERKDADARSKEQGLIERLCSVVPAEANLWCKPECKLMHGSPSHGILDAARELQSDLIVLGARHPEPARINSHLPWATAARVIAEAHCPVLTVREGESNDACA